MATEFGEYAHVWPIDRKFRNRWFEGSFSDDGLETVLWEKEKWLETYTNILNEVGASLEKPRIGFDEDKKEFQLRARLRGLPVRVFWSLNPDDISYPGFVAVEIKVSSSIRELSLLWDPAKMPRSKDDEWSEDWEEEDDGLVRVFVAKTIFVEGPENFVLDCLQALDSIPADLREKLYETLWAIPLNQIEIRQSGESLRSSFEKNVLMLADPVRDIWKAIDVMAELAERTRKDSAGPQTPKAAGEKTIFDRVSCAFCTTRYVLGLRDSCPNCGAPYAG